MSEKQLRHRKFGLVKHFFIALIFLLGAIQTARADPATLTTIAISLAISAATTAATYLVTTLTKNNFFEGWQMKPVYKVDFTLTF